MEIPDIWVRIGKAAKYSAYSRNIISNYEYILEANVANNVGDNLYHYRLINNESIKPIMLVPRISSLSTNDIVQEKYPDMYYSKQMKELYKVVLNNSSNTIDRNLFGWNYNMGKGSVINNKQRNYRF